MAGSSLARSGDRIDLPTANALPNSLSPGPDGNVWFTELKAHQIARITPAGVITEFPMPPLEQPVGAEKPSPTAGAPFGIAAGADKSLWVTITREPFIYRVSPSGAFTAIPTPDGTVASFITAGPDGNLWFTEPNGKIAKLTPRGTITEFVAAYIYQPD